MTILITSSSEQEVEELCKLKGYSLEGDSWVDEFGRYTFAGELSKCDKKPTPTYEIEKGAL